MYIQGLPQMSRTIWGLSIVRISFFGVYIGFFCLWKVPRAVQRVGDEFGKHSYVHVASDFFSHLPRIHGHKPQTLNPKRRGSFLL